MASDCWCRTGDSIEYSGNQARQDRKVGRLKKFLNLKKYSKIKMFSLGLALVLGLSVIGTGIAFAAYYGFHTTTANIQVNEALSVSCDSGTGFWALDNGAPATGTWIVTAYPGDTQTLTLRIANSGDAALTASVSGSWAGSSCGTISGMGDYAVPAGGSVVVPVVLSVDHSVIPGAYVYTVTFQR